MTDIPRLRKRPLEADAAASGRAANEIDIVSRATISYSSEDPTHPVEHLLDGQSGPGATRWMSARADTIEHVVLEFDRPHTISRLVYEVEEPARERTQEVRVEVSEDGARTYRQILVQEYNFSPRGATYNAKNSALISTALAISVLRLFRTRTVPARRLLRRSASSRKRPGFDGAIA
jgi:hypothetical protein